MSHIDNQGRIYIDGFHVGWVRKDAPVDCLTAFSHRLRMAMPMASGMCEVRESEGEAR